MKGLIRPLGGYREFVRTLYTSRQNVSIVTSQPRILKQISYIITIIHNCIKSNQKLFTYAGSHVKDAQIQDI